MRQVITESSAFFLHLYTHGKLVFKPLNLPQESWEVGGIQNTQQAEKYDRKKLCFLAVLNPGLDLLEFAAQLEGELIMCSFIKINQ